MPKLVINKGRGKKFTRPRLHGSNCEEEIFSVLSVLAKEGLFTSKVGANRNTEEHQNFKINVEKGVLYSKSHIVSSATKGYHKNVAKSLPIHPQRHPTSVVLMKSHIPEAMVCAVHLALY